MVRAECFCTVRNSKILSLHKEASVVILSVVFSSHPLWNLFNPLSSSYMSKCDQCALPSHKEKVQNVQNDFRLEKPDY